MADAGLFIGWGQVVRNREKRALDVFNESMAYYASLEQDGKVESWEVVLLEPHGGDLAGFVLLRGSVDQMHAVRNEEEFQRRTTRADLIVENLGVVSAALGQGLADGMAIYQDEIAAVS
ncbi:MAG TPA: hypothetical protein VGF21_09195 [Thermoleophilaceae bacterium]|jgi:hypothetical protein